MEGFIQNFDYFVVMSLVITTVISSFLNLVRKDILAILILVILGSSHILSGRDLFWGFRSETSIVIIATSIIFSAFKQAGLHVVLAKKIHKSLISANYSWIFWHSTLLVSALASVLRSIGATTIMLQTIALVNKRRNVARSILLPIAYMSIVGGTLTVIGSLPFILTNDLLHSNYLTETFNYLSHKDILIIGSMLLTSCFTFILLSHSFKSYQKLNQPLPNINYNFLELALDQDNNLCKKTIRQAENLLGTKIFIIAIQDETGKQIIFPRSNLKLTPDKIIVIAYPTSEQANIELYTELKNVTKLNVFADKIKQEGIAVTKFIVTDNCKFIGHTYRELNVERRNNFLLHTLIRHDITLYHHIKDQIIKAGDTLMGLASSEALHKISKQHNELLIIGGLETENTKHLTIATCCMLISLLLIYIFKYSVALSLLTSAGLMLLTKLISADTAYTGIHWRTLFIVVGQLALANASIKSGFAVKVATSISQVIGNLSIFTNTCIIAASCSVIATLTSPIESCILLIPVGIFLAQYIGVPTESLALLISLACLNSFLIPNRSTYALIYNYGRYQLSEFLKFGKWMALIYYITLCLSFYLFVI